MLICSFDVFDTAITRLWFRPTDAFLPVGAKLRQLGLFEDTDEAWRSLRVKAEEGQRKIAVAEEVTLDEIFHNLAAQLMWSDDQRRRAAEVELDQELACVRPIGLTLARVAAKQRAREDVIFVSDTYFSKAFVLKLLHRCGYEFPDDNLFASSELGLTKGTGSMFAHIAAHYGVAPIAIAHTGDNREADWHSARREGVSALYFGEQEPNRYETLFFAGRQHPLALRSAFAGCSRAVRLQRDLCGGAKDLWTTSANVVGPLLFAYVLWLVLEAQKQGLRRLYFLARDGQILLKLAKRIVQWLGLSLECKYLYVSREALFLASVDTASACSVSWLEDILTGRILRQVLGRVDLTPEDVAGRLASLDCDVSDPERTLDAAELSRLVEVFAEDEELRAMLLSSAAKRRALLLDYLRQEGFADGTPFGLVDLGWKGRLQYALARALRTSGDLAGGLPLAGFYFGLAVQPPSEVGNCSTFAEVNGDMNAVLLETFCAADHGTTRGYRRGEAGRIEAVLAEEGNPAALDWGLRHQQEAAEEFASHLMQCLDPVDLDVARLAAFARDVSRAAFRLMVRQPSCAEALVFGGIAHAEGQAHAEEVQLAPALDRGELMRWLVRPRRATRVRSFWPEGSFARSATGTSLRTCLMVWKLRGVLAGLKRLVSR